MVVIASAATASGVSTMAVSSVIISPPPPPYGYSIAAVDTAKAEGDSGATTFTFIVTKFGDLSGATSISWSIQPGGSTAPSTNIVNAADFGGNPMSGEVSFAPGETSQILTVTVSGDLVAETDEQFTVTLGIGASFTSATKPPDWADRVSATILNDDATVSATYSLGWGTGGYLGSVGFIEQGDGVTPTTVNFTITRSGDVTQAGSVDWSIVGSGAAPASAADFIGGVFPGGTAQFAAGEVTKTILIPILNDYITEPTEGFQILLSNPSAGTRVDVGVLDRTILDDDTAMGFAVATTTASVVEGQPGSVTDYTFTVYRSGDVSGTASVDWSIGSAFVPGAPQSAFFSDFALGTATSGTVNFATGESSRTITLSVNGDLEYETNEAFSVNLSNPSAGTPILVGSANGVILNDDPQTPPTTFSIAATDAVKAEGTGDTTHFVFTVTRTGDLTYGGTVNWTVGYQTGNPAVLDPFDFAFGVSEPFGTLSFAPGEASRTVTINIAGDSTVELDEALPVYLSNPSEGSAISTTEGTATGTIINDDVPASPVTFLSIAASDANKAEGNFGWTNFSFVITRTGDLSVPVSVNWAASAGPNALASADIFDFPPTGIAAQVYQMPTGTVAFTPGDSVRVVNVWVNTDSVVEADEQFTMTLGGVSAGGAITTATASGTILNDDTPPLDYVGTTGNNTISFATATTDKRLDLSQGGSDTATGGGGNDTFLLGAALNSTDKINGGGGGDTLVLDGNYAAGITLGSSTVTNVETFVLAAGNSYRITTNSATVASGATLTVDASALSSLNSATINGSSESNGRFVFLGGAGNDVFTGGSGTDVFVGAGGADALKGNSGADVFRYLAASDSPFVVSGGAIDTSVIDVITGFQAGTDKLDLSAFLIPAGAQSVVTRSTSAFSTGAVNGAGFFGTAGVAVEQASLNRVTTTRVYVDANHDSNLGAGDALIQLTGVSRGAFGASSVTF